MHLTSLLLHHFRNYHAARLEVDARPVVLFGHNGAGKTNILEAISFLVPGRGLRKAKLAEIDCNGGGQPWVVAAHVMGLHGEAQIGTGRDASTALDSDKRIVKIDGKLARAQSDLAQHVSLLWLTPQMDGIFMESGSEKRKFLDRLATSFDPSHATHLNAYETAMRERNKLLEEQRGDAHWLDALETKMSEMATAIAHARLETLSKLNEAMRESTNAFPKAEVSVQGLVEDKLAAGESALSAENALRHALAQSRAQDAAAGRTLVGAHRSELFIKNIEKQSDAASSSTGEQKAMLLSIILAQARANAKRGIVPIMLLDEVVAHLDASHRTQLFEEILALQTQAWLTGTDAGLFEGLRGGAQFFEVAGGIVTKSSFS